MNKEIKKYLHDISVSIKAIEDYIEDEKNFFKFDKHRMLKKAVEREFEIIGEAMKRILEIEKDIQITKARKIIDLRNYLAHGYDSVDYGLLWGVINRHLPILKEEVELLLSK